MTDQDVVERFAYAIGVGKVKGPIRYACSKPHHKELFEWALYGRNIIPVVTKMLPYLGLRRRAKALELLDWYGRKNSRELGEGEGSVGGER